MSRDDLRARAFLDALVAESSPTRARTEASLRAIEHRLQANQVVAVAATPWLRASVIAVAIAAGVLLTIAAVGAGVRAIRDPDGTVGDAASDEPDSAPLLPAELGVPVAAPASMPAVPSSVPERGSIEPTPRPRAEDVQARRRTSESVSPHAEVASRASDLAAEVALIRAAKAQSDHTAAIALLDRHAREFADGTLARERELLRAERMCALGRIDEVRAIAARVLADGRDDPLARRLRGICAGR